MRKQHEIEKKAIQLKRRIIDLELLGCARRPMQERELQELTAGYDALMYTLGVSSNCRALR